MEMYVSCLLVVLVLSASLTTGELQPKRRREVADSHEHWEKIVRRSVSNWRRERHVTIMPEIASVQDYYRQVLDSSDGWSDTEEAHDSENYRQFDRQKTIPGRYIVLFEDGISDHHLDRTIQILREADQESRTGILKASDFTPIRKALKGFSATLSSNIVELLWQNPTITTIDTDIALKRGSPYHHYMGRSIHARSQKFVPWNLDRLDQHENKLDGVYNPEGGGEGVEVYIFDTGIRYSHIDFGGRAKYEYDAIDLLTGSNNKGADCNGHGTHCAGTAAGKLHGVAKKATLYSVRVLGCSGSGAVSGIIHALDHVLSKGSSARKIISMSLGVHNHKAFKTIVDKTVESGIVVVAASGNQGRDACSISPGNAALSISVAATDRDDVSAFYSNLGKCVDIFAPGHEITSAGYSCDHCEAEKSGTSMACPHVAGYVAVLLGIDPSLSPAAVKQRLIEHATKGAVKYSRINSELASVTENRLLYVPDMGSVEEDKQ